MAETVRRLFELEPETRLIFLYCWSLKTKGIREMENPIIV